MSTNVTISRVQDYLDNRGIRDTSADWAPVVDQALVDLTHEKNFYLEANKALEQVNLMQAATIQELRVEVASLKLNFYQPSTSA
jgi:hypothetical protein